MTDTQLTRWQVFKQDSEKKAHAAVGSVHAADTEHALLMARTVFARRPAAVSMWIAPADAVTEYTREECTAAAASDDTDDAQATSQPGRRFLLFYKTSDRRTMAAFEHVGEVEAPSPAAALRSALRLPASDGEPPLGAWVIAAEAVTSSDPHDAEPWFSPAQEKRYKQQSEYAVKVRRHAAPSRGAPSGSTR